jgi:hypothetical protein
VCVRFYVFGASLGIAGLARFWMDCAAAATTGSAAAGGAAPQQLARSAALGGFCGVVVSAVVLAVPVIGVLLSRLSDSFLYVPRVVPALREMDTLYREPVPVRMQVPVNVFDALSTCAHYNEQVTDSVVVGCRPILAPGELPACFTASYGRWSQASSSLSWVAQLHLAGSTRAERGALGATPLLCSAVALRLLESTRTGSSCFE